MAGRCMGYHNVGYLRFEVFWQNEGWFGGRSSNLTAKPLVRLRRAAKRIKARSKQMTLCRAEQVSFRNFLTKFDLPTSSAA